mmetsp:Transcript_27393/g.76834  ORF Transcript_27393/g.76834 Transcript_27393/m.76834 type:complete len:138 (-) Transcript_27393:1632-2045(-)
MSQLWQQAIDGTLDEDENNGVGTDSIDNGDGWEHRGNEQREEDDEDDDESDLRRRCASHGSKSSISSFGWIACTRYFSLKDNAFSPIDSIDMPSLQMGQVRASGGGLRIFMYSFVIIRAVPISNFVGRLPGIHRRRK